MWFFLQKRKQKINFISFDVLNPWLNWSLMLMSGRTLKGDRKMVSSLWDEFHSFASLLNFDERKLAQTFLVLLLFLPFFFLYEWCICNDSEQMCMFFIGCWIVKLQNPLKNGWQKLRFDTDYWYPLFHLSIYLLCICRCAKTLKSQKWDLSSM